MEVLEDMPMVHIKQLPIILIMLLLVVKVGPIRTTVQQVLLMSDMEDIMEVGIALYEALLAAAAGLPILQQEQEFYPRYLPTNHPY